MKLGNIQLGAQNPSNIYMDLTKLISNSDAVRVIYTTPSKIQENPYSESELIMN
jgi:hypothetical protein